MAFLYMLRMFSTQWCQQISVLSFMSFRPLTTGVSAGNSLALALKLLNFDHTTTYWTSTDLLKLPDLIAGLSFAVCCVDWRCMR